MIQRWKIFGNQAAAVTEPDGDYVEYADHLAAIAEKDKEIEEVSARSLQWAKIAGQNQAQLLRLADIIEEQKEEIERLTKLKTI